MSVRSDTNNRAKSVRVVAAYTRKLRLFDMICLIGDEWGTGREDSRGKEDTAGGGGSGVHCIEQVKVKR